jgi:tetratricopeptide (TPR) repeat protein
MQEPHLNLRIDACTAIIARPWDRETNTFYFDNVADAYASRGAAYYAEKEYGNAIADFDKVIELKADASAYAARGLAYNEKGDYDRAIADYDKAIQLERDWPPPADFFYVRGLAYSGKGEYERAIANFGVAIELKPFGYNPEVYYSRGRAYELKADYDSAIADYDRVIKFKPDDAAAYASRGTAYGNKGDYDRAIADFNKAVELKPDDGYAYYRRGSDYAAQGEYAKIPDFRAAVQLIPPSNQWHGQSLVRITELEQTLGRFADQAITRFRSETDAGGKLKHPYLDQVQDRMVSLLQTPAFASIDDMGERLQRAYDAAVGLDPSLRQQVLSVPSAALLRHPSRPRRRQFRRASRTAVWRW